MPEQYDKMGRLIACLMYRRLATLQAILYHPELTSTSQVAQQQNNSVLMSPLPIARKFFECRNMCNTKFHNCFLTRLLLGKQG